MLKVYQDRHNPYKKWTIKDVPHCLVRRDWFSLRDIGDAKCPFLHGTELDPDKEYNFCITSNTGIICKPVKTMEEAHKYLKGVICDKSNQSTSDT